MPAENAGVAAGMAVSRQWQCHALRGTPWHCHGTQCSSSYVTETAADDVGPTQRGDAAATPAPVQPARPGSASLFSGTPACLIALTTAVIACALASPASRGLGLSRDGDARLSKLGTTATVASPVTVMSWNGRSTAAWPGGAPARTRMAGAAASAGSITAVWFSSCSRRA